MALFMVGKRIESVELVTTQDNGLVAVCPGLSHYDLSGFKQRPVVIVALITLAKVLLFTGVMYSFSRNMFSAGLLKILCACIPVLAVGAYALFGFYPLLFGEFEDDVVNVIPMSHVESELIGNFLADRNLGKQNGRNTKKQGVVKK